jgi:hypothetical protein
MCCYRAGLDWPFAGIFVQSEPRILSRARFARSVVAMLRAKPTIWCALGASLGAACLSPEAPTDTDSAPLIGRLQTRDGATDLTIRSFADGPNAVPTNSYARVVADIAPDVRRDHDRTEHHTAGDSSFTHKRDF